MTRDISIDITKGMAMLFMIVAHLFAYATLPWKLFYSFHMPLFFMLSGMVYAYKPWKALIKSSVSRLLRPYVITMFIALVITAAFCDLFLIRNRLMGFIFPDYSMQFGGSAGAIWFLMVLFWARIFFQCIRSCFSRGYVLVALICTIICSYFGRNYFNLPFGILNAGCAVGYMAVGSFIKENNDSFLAIPIWWFGIVIIVWSCLFDHYIFAMYGFHYGNLLWIVLGVILACAMSIVVYRICQYIKQPYSVCVLSWIGKNSLEILVCHELALCFLRCMNAKYGVCAEGTVSYMTILILSTLALVACYIGIRNFRIY